MAAQQLSGDKMKFAIKAALSIVLVYLIGFSQGWSNVSTAATTIMVIAAVGSLENAVVTGLLRVMGTVCGAALGMILIALFPQERFVYLLVLSIFATFFLYLARAYKGDITVFMLTGMTMMMMFQNGQTDNVLLFGIDRTFMTIFGIAVYTLVGILIWPVSGRKKAFESAHNLSRALKKRYEQTGADEARQNQLHDAVLKAQETFSKSLPLLPGALEENFTPLQWRSLLQDFKELNSLITLMPNEKELADLPKPVEAYIKGYKTQQDQIEKLFDAIVRGWHNTDQIIIKAQQELAVDLEAAFPLSQLQRTTLATLVLETKKLHSLLLGIANKLNALHRDEPTRFKIEKNQMSAHAFEWFDREHLKSALLTFLIFWCAVAVWIMFNPPGGFMVVVLATSLSVITTFTTIKPSLLIMVFTVSFLFATAAYIGVLPHLSHPLELALFLFIYSFLGFFLIPLEISIFFVLGIATMNIGNEMYFAFDSFLLGLSMFYAYLFILLFFYYFPFSTKAETLFLMLQKRFQRQSSRLAQYHLALLKGKGGGWRKLLSRYHAYYLMNTVTKMKLWAKEIDTAYFHEIDKTALIAYVRNCERFATLLSMSVQTMQQQKNNPLLEKVLLEEETMVLESMLRQITCFSSPIINHKTPDLSKALENQLASFFQKEEVKRYKSGTIISFYEIISLYEHIWRSFFSCRSRLSSLPLVSLKESRF